MTVAIDHTPDRPDAQPRHGKAPSPPARARAQTAASMFALAAVISTVIVIVTSGQKYTIHALFYNAGRVVTGGEVQVAGRHVGSISSVGLTRNGLADITFTIDDPSLIPLRRGTRAEIREVGAATLANNFIELLPGSGTSSTLPGGSVLGTDQTTGIVDVDTVLDMFSPSTRADVQQLIANSADVYAGSASRYWSGMLAQLDPALGAMTNLSGQLPADESDLAQLIPTASATATAIASRSPDLQSAVTNTATTMQAIADERRRLADFLQRAPAVLAQGRLTLAHVASAVTALRPPLREIPAVAVAADPFLTSLTAMLKHSQPAIGELAGELPGVRAALLGFPPLSRTATPALTATGTAFTAAHHILRGLRFYGTEALLGTINGVAGLASGTFGHSGHYTHVSVAQPLQTVLGGALAPLLTKGPLVPGLFDERIGQTRRCPGGDAPPSPDGSNPWVPDPSLCTPADDMPLSVDFP